MSAVCPNWIFSEQFGSSLTTTVDWCLLKRDTQVHVNDSSEKLPLRKETLGFYPLIAVYLVEHISKTSGFFKKTWVLST